MKNFNEITVMLSGEAGAGIKSTEAILTSVMKEDNINVFSTKEYMSRVRGGTNSTTLRFSSKRISAILKKPDFFLPLDKSAFVRYTDMLTEDTVIIADKSEVEHKNVHDLSFTKIAEEIGSALYASVVAAGTVSAIAGVDVDVLEHFVEKQFEKKGKKVVEANLKACQKGFEEGKALLKKLDIKVDIKKDPSVKDDIVVSGAEAVALGAISGGCDAVFAYPMSPSTSMFTALAGWADKCGLAVEQVEDEIGVINMGIAAWYAGARAIVSTSGGGFALMTEGLSLSGISETPVVIHLAQRPGPGTGLPTRTEQGDLNLTVYAGHGEFARAIFAPGSLQQGYDLAREAFEQADKYQIPSIILTDQYFVDTYYNTEEFQVGEPPQKHIVEAKEGYKRYSLSEGTISPRGVPGFGEGRVCVDSDEHDETGRITEDLDGISMKMKLKRSAKMELVKENAMLPNVYGKEDGKTVVISWGSTLEAVKEAASIINDNIKVLHFPQVFPINPKAKEFFENADDVIIVENNEYGQFAAIIEKEFSIKIDKKILKFNGLPFTVQELVEKIKEVM